MTAAAPDNAAPPAASPPELASWALREELLTWPKPGLVSPRDAGAHADMDAAVFEASIAALGGYFAAIYAAGRENADLPALRALGVAAEEAMLAATGGVNTHRGAIFTLGLLLAAAGRRDAGHAADAATLGDDVRRTWGPLLCQVPADATPTHGLAAMRRHGVSGARGQAATGFPQVYAVGRPALRRAAPAGWNAAKVQCLFAILARLDDTNLLHRGGADGLATARDECQAFLDAGGVLRPDWLAHAQAIHARFVARRLSPGGAGDLLAATLLVHALEPAPATEAPPCSP